MRLLFCIALYTYEYVSAMNVWIRLPHRYRSICAVTTSNGYLRFISNSQTLAMSRFNNITINWMSTRHKFSAVNLIRSTVSIIPRVHAPMHFPIVYFSFFFLSPVSPDSEPPRVITFYTNLPVNDFQSRLLYTTALYTK